MNSILTKTGDAVATPGTTVARPGPRIPVLAAARSSLLRFFTRFRLWGLVVVVPSVMLAVYYATWCTDRYVSSARALVERDPSSSSTPIDIGILSFGNSQSAQDAQLVKAFVLSAAMLDYLDQNMALRAHYSATTIDWFSRLSSDASHEKFLRYYLNHVKVEIDPDSSTLMLDIQGFDAGYAQRLANAITARAEQFVNDVGRTLALEQLSFVQVEVDKANERLKSESAKMRDMQDRNKLLSPEAESMSIGQVIAGLQAELARQRTEIKALGGYLMPGAPELFAARQKEAALLAQIEQERAKQVHSGGARPLNDLLLQFQEQSLNVQIATDLYQAGLKSLESARLEASRKVKHLVMVSAPTLPDASEMPTRLYNVVSAFVMLNLLYFAVSIFMTAVKDHRE